MSNNNNFAWCTLVMLGDNYVPGAIVVARSLRNVNTKYPIYCMVDDSVSDSAQKILEKYFDKVIKVPIIEYKCTPMKSKKQNEIYGAWISKSFTKWNIFNPQIFNNQKICFLDADCIALENIDDLFDLPGQACCWSSPWSREYMPKNSRYSLYDPYGKMEHGQEVSRKSIMRGFNNSFLGLACMVLISPSQHLWDKFNEILRNEPIYGHNSVISGHDEQILAETFLATGKNIYHISPQYTCLIGKEKMWLGPDVKPKLLQWYGPKPWTQDPSKEGQWEDVRQWWQIAFSIIEEDPETADWFYLNQ
ncbi:glycogenin-1 [Pacmanvirus S19]|nr:glycogenin-1 [Pacmanvirus S19]